MEPERITKTFVEREDLAPGMYSDEKTPGFRLKVTPAGKRVYLVYGKVKGQPKPVKVTIGEHGKPWSAPAAEDKAREIYALMRKGINPNEERKKKQVEAERQEVARQAKEQAESLTLERVFDEYLLHSKLKENTMKTYSYIVRSRFEDWLPKRIIDITGDMCLQRHALISESFPVEANHALRILRALFFYVMERYTAHDGTPLIAANPVKRLRKQWNKMQPRTEVIREIDLAPWCSAVLQADNSVASDYLLFLLFTGLRKNEAAKLKWKDFANLKADDSYVDRRTGLLLVKNPKNGRDHSLPLTNFLSELIERRWNARINDYVFPGEGARGHICDARFTYEKIIKTVQAETGDASFSFTPHALRRTFITIAKRLGIDPDFIRGLANHKTGDVSSVHYTGMDDADRLATMQRITDYIVEKAKLKPVAKKSTKQRAPKVISISKAVR